MANAQLMEEELQHSVMVAEQDADIQMAEEATRQVEVGNLDDADGEIDVQGDGANNDQTIGGNDADADADVDAGADADADADADEDEDADADADADADEDAEGEDDVMDAVNGGDYDQDNGGSDAPSARPDDDSESGADEVEDEDADGEEEDIEDDRVFEEENEDNEDEDVHPNHMGRQRDIPSIEEDDAEDEDDEGVGAVKFKPGETDDEDDEDGSEASGASEEESDIDEESEGGAAWDSNAENEEDDDAESDVAEPNTCMFCKQDEDNDPSEEFEAYLACAGCGENAHQQCARDNDARGSGEPGPSKWKCPECLSDSDADADENADADVDAEVDDDGEAANRVHSPGSPASLRRATAPKLARDLLPSQRGTNKPDSHSVFNKLVLDEDPMDGSRVLRKRKTSSVEADENITSLRKRRRTTTDDLSIDEAKSVEQTPGPQSARSLRIKVPKAPAASIKKKTRTSLVLNLRVNPAQLEAILKKRPKGKKRAPRASQKARGTVRPSSSRGAVQVGSATAITPVLATSFSQPFYSFFDKETDDLKGKPYGGILSEGEADTSKTMPNNDDRRRFDEAKQNAEEEWRLRILDMQAEAEMPARKSKKNAGPASQIECIEFGGWEIDTWYAAPYPEEYSRHRVLYICEFCLKYMNSDYVAWRHKLKCPAKHPPGDEIYRYRSISVFEVDGRKNPVYCQNLCLLAKLFLGSKTLYYDVEPFLFYVLCEYDDLGYHFVGYFSKEKRASSQNNVSCILTLPIHQRKGYGNLLIDFSYLLTKVENKTGSPEKPLSDMGLVSYRNYWRLVICRYLLDRVSEDKSEKVGMSVKAMSDETGMTADDVIAALEGLRCLVRESQSGLYAFRVDLAYCREYVQKWESKKYVTLKPAALTWTPYVMGRGNATNFELGPALTAIAPREEEENIQPPDDETPDANLANGEVIDDSAAVVSEDTEPQPIDTPAAERTELNGDAEEPEAELKPMQEDTATASEAKSADVVETNGSPEVANDPSDWTTQYNGIPSTKFVVFPPVSRTANRPRTIARGSNGGATTTPRPRPRRSFGGVRKSASRLSGSSSRRRTSGGTGRGPGRWPKGTKKSDYGNADSGPGLPPGWRATKGAGPGNGEGSKDSQAGDAAADTVEVKGENSNKIAASPGKEKTKVEVDGDDLDLVMTDVPVIGEDEDDE